MNAYAENRKVRHDYDILETYEAGMVLIGQEVKSIRGGRIALAGSYIVFNNGHAELIGANIPAYQPKNAPDGYQPQKPRRLLLNKKELIHLKEKSQERGFSLIPLKVYDSNGKVKLEFALVRGKKKYDKREQIRKRDVERDIRRTIRE